MKIIKTINIGSSDYSGKTNKRTELMLKAAPKTDENGIPLKARQRYYIIRLLSYEHGNRKDSPFIIRNEHICFHQDAEGKLTSIEKIVCPMGTSWASKELAKHGEPVGRGYCPICDFSFNKNKEAFRVKGQCDKVSAKLAKETKRVWAAYWPAYIVSDPNYPNNNQHFMTIRFAEKDKEAFNRLVTLVNSLLEQNVNPFGAEDGVNIGILVEKETKFILDKEGNKVISKATGQPISYQTNEIKDIRALSTHASYPEITDEAVEELQFDETYGVAKNRDELMQFLEDNWLNMGVSDDDFDTEFATPPPVAEAPAATAPAVEDDGFSEPVPAPTPKVASVAEEVKDDGLDGDTAVDIISSIVGKSATESATPAKKTITSIPPNADEVREKIDSSSDLDDLPF